MMEIIRTLAVFAHLLFFAFSISLVLWSDRSILKGTLDSTGLKMVAETVVALLVCMWVTGLLLIYIDTGFVLSAIAENSKLLLKLVCVCVLTLNGYLIHNVALRIFCSEDYLTRKNARVLAFLGAISTGHWLLAGFVGIASPLKEYSFSQLLSVYSILLLVIGLISLAVSGLVQDLVNLQRAERKISYLALHKNALSGSTSTSLSESTGRIKLGPALPVSTTIFHSSIHQHQPAAGYVSEKPLPSLVEQRAKQHSVLSTSQAEL